MTPEEILAEALKATETGNFCTKLWENCGKVQLWKLLFRFSPSENMFLSFFAEL